MTYDAGGNPPSLSQHGRLELTVSCGTDETWKIGDRAAVALPRPPLAGG